MPITAAKPNVGDETQRDQWGDILNDYLGNVSDAVDALNDALDGLNFLPGPPAGTTPGYAAVAAVGGGITYAAVPTKVYNDIHYALSCTPEGQGAVGDGVHDDTAAVNAAIAAAQAGGGEVRLTGGRVYLCLGAVFAVYSGTSSSPIQSSVRITSSATAASSGYFLAPSLNGSAVLDLRYDGTDGLHPAKIENRGAGWLELCYLTLISGGTDNFPFFQTTNTKAHVHHNTFIGNAANSGVGCLQDAIIFGGSSHTIGDGMNAPFQGYGGRVHDNEFSRIRRGFVGQTYCNGIPVEYNLFSRKCGSATGAAIEFYGGDTGQASTGCSTRGNTVETQYYKYGIALYNVTNGTFGPDEFFDTDPANGYQGAIFVDSQSKYNTAIAGFYADAYPFVIDAGGTTTVINGHQSQPSVWPSRLFLTDGALPAASINTGGNGIRTYRSGGHASGLVTGSGSGSVPEARVTTYAAVAVTDGTTTTVSGVTTVGSATAAWTAQDVGLPISGGTIPSGARILQRVSATAVVIDKAATGADATGLALTFGRIGTTGVTEIAFSSKHIVTQGATGAATVSAGAGTGATVAASGTDTAFTVTLNTGTATAVGLLCKVAVAVSSGVSKLTLTPKNDAARAAMPFLFLTNTSTFVTFNVGGTALPASTTFIFDVLAVY